jgi:hypothetical protein
VPQTTKDPAHPDRDDPAERCPRSHCRIAPFEIGCWF